MRNKFLLALLFLSLAVSGQTIYPLGHPSQITKPAGWLETTKGLRVPDSSTVTLLEGREKGQLQMAGERLQYNEGDGWESIITDSLLYDRMYALIFPPEFTYRPYQIVRNKLSKWYITATTFENNFEEDFKNATPYYISPDGNDANDGLTPATGKRTILSAYNAGGSLFLCSEGMHMRDVLQGLNVDRNIAIIGVGGKTFFTGKNLTYSWSAYNDIYTATVSSVRNIVDYKYKDEFGFFVALKRLNSIAEVEATPNSWYSSGTVIYANLLDGRAPDSELDVYVPFASSTVTLNASSGNIYFEGIEFIGRGGSGTNEAGNGNLTITGTGSTPTVRAFIKDCKFMHGLYEGYRINNVMESYVENCYAYGNNFDGFNYKSSLITGYKFVEYNCTSIRNGYFGNSTTDNVNGSSSHNGGIGLRINGDYSYNFGPNLPDVGAGALILNIGTTAGYSRGLETSPDVNGGNYDYVIGDGSGTLPVTTQMWCVDCYSDGSTVSFKARLNGKAEIVNSVYSAPVEGDVTVISDIASSYQDSDYNFNTSAYPAFNPSIAIDAAPTSASANVPSSGGTFSAIANSITNIGFGTNPVTSTDISAITQSGLHLPASAATPGLPVANVNISVFHMNQSSTAATQLAIRAATGDFWWRAKASSTWGSWNKGASEAYADAKVANNTSASTTVAPSKTAMVGYVDGKIVQTVTNGVTATVPSQDAVYDYVQTTVSNATANLFPYTWTGSTGLDLEGLSNYYQTYTHTGAAVTYTMPPVPGGAAITIKIVNAGSGNINLVTDAGGSDLWINGISNTGLTIAPGETAIFENNTLKWVKMN